MNPDTPSTSMGKQPAEGLKIRAGRMHHRVPSKLTNNPTISETERSSKDNDGSVVSSVAGEELSASICRDNDSVSGLAGRSRFPTGAVLRIWCSVAGRHAHPSRSGVPIRVVSKLQM